MENMHSDVRVYRATEFGDLLHKMSASRIIGVTSYKNNTDSSGIMLNLFSKKAKGVKTNAYPCFQLCSSSDCDDFCCSQDS